MVKSQTVFRNTFRKADLTDSAVREAHRAHFVSEPSLRLPALPSCRARSVITLFLWPHKVETASTIGSWARKSSTVRMEESLIDSANGRGLDFTEENNNKRGARPRL